MVLLKGFRDLFARTKKTDLSGSVFFDEASGTRTPDTLIKSQVLYRLS